MSSYEKKPEWLKIKYRANRNISETDEILRRYGLNTVCEEAACPNRMECFSKRTATFMILGSNCTRNCTFCNVQKGELCAPDPEEPQKVALASVKLGLVYVVITSVTRDDLADGGAYLFAQCVEEIRKAGPEIKVEVLIPDFRGDREALRKVINARPFVLNHNIETVSRLYPEVRPQAQYMRSLELLRHVKEDAPDMLTKSGIMLGLGETRDEVEETIRDLAGVKTDILTIGQYLAPSRQHHEVVRYAHPDEFEHYRKYALAAGFSHAASGPFVRSSYNASEAMSI